MIIQQFDRGMFRTEGQPAPGDLVRVHGFLNTWSEELGIEDLSTPQSTEQWLRSAALWEDAETLSHKDHQLLLDFRSKLRDGVRDPRQMHQLNKWASTRALHIKFNSNGAADLTVSGRGAQRVIGMLTTTVFTSMTEGTWVRFKCCALASCGWAYYDNTRSRTRRWCSMRTCGSRNKARAYYKRQK